MDNYYKEQFEKTHALLKLEQRKSRFYEIMAHFICGMTNALIFFALIPCGTIIIFCIKKYSSQPEVVVAILTLSFGVVGVIFRYRAYIFNWPEKLYHDFLQREKEKETRNIP